MLVLSALNFLENTMKLVNNTLQNGWSMTKLSVRPYRRLVFTANFHPLQHETSALKHYDNPTILGNP